MKVVLPKTTKKTKRLLVAPIPLERPKKKELRKDDYLTFKLRNNPTDANSTTYDATVPYFSSGKPEEVLDFVRDVNRVIVGQGITNAPGKYALMRRLLKAEALAAFDNAATEAGTETNAHFTSAVQGLIASVFPQRALSTQKRCMRRFMRKPAEQSMRQFMARLNEINGKLKEFPPFENNQSLPQEEILDIGEFATPSRWQREMIIQDFNPVENDVAALVNFCERMERTEESDGTAVKKTSTKEVDFKIPKKRKSYPSNNKGLIHAEKWCAYCEMDNHSTSECQHIKRLREEREQKRRKMTWKRTEQKSYDKKNYSKEQLNTIIGEAVKQQVNAMFKSNKKRKAESFAINVDSDSEDEVEELNVADVAEQMQTVGLTSDTESGLEDNSDSD